MISELRTGPAFPPPLASMVSLPMERASATIGADWSVPTSPLYRTLRRISSKLHAALLTIWDFALYPPR